MALVAENQCLRELLAQRDRRLAEQDLRLAEQDKRLVELAARAYAAEEFARRMKTELELLRKQIRGPSSEVRRPEPAGAGLARCRRARGLSSSARRR